MLRKDKRANKRGLLLSQIIEILIAVAIVIIIIIAAQRLFATYFGKQKDLQAKGTLDILIQKLNTLQEGETISYLLLAPAGWHLVSFDSSHDQNRDGFKKPHSYFEKTVLCVCETKDCKICQTIKMPLMQGIELADIEIKILDLWITNLKDYYNITLTKPAYITEFSEEERILSLAYSPSNTKIDEWLKEKNSPLAGLGQCIIDTSTNTKVPQELILAVAIHESNWSRSDLAQQCKNLFGVKGIGTNGSCEMLTKENLEGKEVEIKDIFSKYSTACQSIMDFGKIISTSLNYQDAMNYTKDMDRMVYAIHGCSGPYTGQQCIYATDPQWADKVIAIINQIKEAKIIT